MYRKRLNQASLARAVGISQSTVSRVLNGTLKRQGAARRKLFDYAKINALTQIQESRKGCSQVIKAFERIWDGSEQHAAAVAKIIEALENLRPAGTKTKGESSDG
jgi:transcriptional regulator with XRE-family HTH domain